MDSVAQNLMKLRLSVSRKAGAPGYGSDGASAEVEVEIEGTAAAIAANAPTWFLALEQAVGAELRRIQATHPQPAPQPQPAHRAEPEPRWNGKETRPPARRPEPGYDDDRETPPRESLPNGRDRSGWQDNPPQSGRQLLGWAHSHGQNKRLLALAKSWNLGRILDWGQGEIAAAYRELNTQTRTAGSWEGR